MSRWLMIVTTSVVLASGGMGAAMASEGASSAHSGSNTFGLCTAYSSGSSQGQAQKQAHGVAFVTLAATAVAWDTQNDNSSSNTEATETTEPAQQQVSEYCSANGAQP
ncbi:MAG: hypothetical protein ACYCZV_06455 [Acidimicrobiales bacterium]